MGDRFSDTYFLEELRGAPRPSHARARKLLLSVVHNLQGDIRDRVFNGHPVDQKLNELAALITLIEFYEKHRPDMPGPLPKPRD